MNPREEMEKKQEENNQNLSDDTEEPMNLMVELLVSQLFNFQTKSDSE